MMSTSLLKIIIALTIFVITLVAGWYPFQRKKIKPQHHDFPIGESLASGIFLGAGLLHMLSDSSRSFDRLGYTYPIAFLLAGSTFLLFLLLEHIGRELYHHQGEKHPAFALLAVIMLSIHALLAGAALGLSTVYTVVVALFFAIIVHKWAASFALAIKINKSDLSPKMGKVYFAMFSVMTPIGILLGDLVTNSLDHYVHFAPVFAALAAGTFLYLGTLHGLDRAVMIKQCCSLKYFCYMLIGFALMALLALWV